MWQSGWNPVGLLTEQRLQRQEQRQSLQQPSCGGACRGPCGACLRPSSFQKQQPEQQRGLQQQEQRQPGQQQEQLPERKKEQQHRAEQRWTGQQTGYENSYQISPDKKRPANPAQTVPNHPQGQSPVAFIIGSTAFIGRLGLKFLQSRDISRNRLMSALFQPQTRRHPPQTKPALPEVEPEQKDQPSFLRFLRSCGSR